MTVINLQLALAEHRNDGISWAAMPRAIVAFQRGIGAAAGTWMPRDPICLDGCPTRGVPNIGAIIAFGTGSAFAVLATYRLESLQSGMIFGENCLLWDGAAVADLQLRQLGLPHP